MQHGRIGQVDPIPPTQQAKGALRLVDHGAANPFWIAQRPEDGDGQLEPLLNIVNLI